MLEHASLILTDSARKKISLTKRETEESSMFSIAHTKQQKNVCIESTLFQKLMEREKKIHVWPAWD